MGIAAVEEGRCRKAAACDRRRVVRDKSIGTCGINVCVCRAAREGDFVTARRGETAALDADVALCDRCLCQRCAVGAVLDDGKTADDAPLILRCAAVGIHHAPLDSRPGAGDLRGAALREPCVGARGSAEGAALDERRAARVCACEVDGAVREADLSPCTRDECAAVVTARRIVDLGCCAAARCADGDGRRRAVRAARDAVIRHRIRRDGGGDDGIGVGCGRCAEGECPRCKGGEDFRRKGRWGFFVV